MKAIFKSMISAVLVLSLGLSLGACGSTAKKAKADAEPTTQPTTPPTTAAPTGAQNVLLMSLVDYDAPTGGRTLRNNKQVDFILLMTIDDRQEKTTAVQIDPTVEVKFTPQGASEAIAMPLGEVFTYGSGGSDSKLSVLNCISSLMDHVRIDHYMTFDADAVSLMADMLDGVSVPADAAYAAAYPESVEDGMVELGKQNAESFFNYHAPEEGDNTPHMHRQQQFIRGVHDLFVTTKRQEDFVTQLSLKLGEKMDTDLTLSQMLKMMETLQKYALDDSIQVLKKGDR